MADRRPLPDNRERLTHKLSAETWPAQGVDLAWRSSIFILCVLPIVLLPAGGMGAGALIICAAACSAYFGAIHALAPQRSPSRPAKTVALLVIWSMIAIWLAA